MNLLNFLMKWERPDGQTNREEISCPPPPPPPQEGLSCDLDVDPVSDPDNFIPEANTSKKRRKKKEKKDNPPPPQDLSCDLDVDPVSEPDNLTNDTPEAITSKKSRKKKGKKDNRDNFSVESSSIPSPNGGIPTEKDKSDKINKLREDKERSPLENEGISEKSSVSPSNKMNASTDLGNSNSSAKDNKKGKKKGEGSNNSAKPVEIPLKLAPIASFLKNIGIKTIKRSLDNNIRVEIVSNKKSGEFLRLSVDNPNYRPSNDALKRAETFVRNTIAKIIVGETLTVNEEFLSSNAQLQQLLSRELVFLCRSTSSSTLNRPCEENILIVEHPWDWNYEKIWEFCEKYVGVAMDKTYCPSSDNELQKSCKVPNCKRSLVKILMTSTTNTQPSSTNADTLESKKTKCLNFKIKNVPELKTQGNLFFRFVLPPQTGQSSSFATQSSMPSVPSSPAVELPDGWVMKESSSKKAYGGPMISVTLVYWQDSKQCCDEIKTLLQQSHQLSQFVYSIDTPIQIELVKSNWEYLEAIFLQNGVLSSNLHVDWNSPPYEISVSGVPSELVTAMKKWCELMNSMDIYDVDVDESKEGFLSSVGLLDKIMLKKEEILADSSFQNESSSTLSNASQSSKSSSKSCATLSREIGIFPTFDKDVMTGLKIQIGFFPGDSPEQRVKERDIVRRIRRIMQECIDTYSEETMHYHEIRPKLVHDLSARSKLQEIPDTLIYWFDKMKKIVFHGSPDSISAVKKFLTETPAEEQEKTLHLSAGNKTIAALFCHPKCKNELKALLNSIEELDEEIKVQPVIYDENSDIIAELRGPSARLNVVEGKCPALLAAVKQKMIQVIPWNSQSHHDAPIEHFLQTDEGKDFQKRILAQVGAVEMPNTTTTTTTNHSNISGSYSLNNGSITINIMVGDILKSRAVAIVNPANGRLSNAGGLARAIEVEAGSQFKKACQMSLSKYSGNVIPCCDTVITDAFNITKKNPFIRYVLNAVGHAYSSQKDLRSEYVATVWSILDVANENKLNSIAIPLLGAGIYGWPVDIAARCFMIGIFSWILLNPDSSIKQLLFVDQGVSCIQALLSNTDALTQRGILRLSDACLQLASFKGLSQNFNSQSQSRKSPFRVWYWEWVERSTWVPYDYDQVCQLEETFLDEKGRDRPLPSDSFVNICGDIAGKRSDSKFIPEGAASARYEIGRGTCNSVRENLVCQYYQRNSVSKFTRAVKCEVYNPQIHTMWGFSSNLPTQKPSSNRTVFRFNPSSLQSNSFVTVAAISDGNTVRLKKNHVLRVICFRENKTLVEQTFLDEVTKLESISSEIDWSNTAPLEWDDVLIRLREKLDVSNMHVAVIPVKNSCSDDDNCRKFQLKCYGAIQMAQAEKLASQLQSSLLEMRIKQSEDIIWPQYWEKINGKEFNVSESQCNFVPVAADSVEWKFVESEWRGLPAIRRGQNPAQAIFHNQIVSIERVQNPRAWFAYYSRLSLISRHLASSSSADVFAGGNECWMKHGTRTMDPKEIAKKDYGLDFRYCSGGYYGTAAYTADEATYSHGYRYTVPNSRSQSQMFLVRVAAGKIHEVSSRNNCSQLREPPNGYHSVRGPVDNGMAIMVYQTDQAYPAYLITYNS